MLNIISILRKVLNNLSIITFSDVSPSRIELLTILSTLKKFLELPIYDLAYLSTPTTFEQHGTTEINVLYNVAVNLYNTRDYLLSIKIIVNKIIETKPISIAIIKLFIANIQCLQLHDFAAISYDVLYNEIHDPECQYLAAKNYYLSGNKELALEKYIDFIQLVNGSVKTKFRYLTQLKYAENMVSQGLLQS